MRDNAGSTRAHQLHVNHTLFAIWMVTPILALRVVVRSRRLSLSQRRWGERANQAVWLRRAMPTMMTAAHSFVSPEAAIDPVGTAEASMLGKTLPFDK